MQKRKLGKRGLEVSAIGYGTTKLHRLEENLGAAEVELTTGDLREIEEAAARIVVHGARYPERLQQRVGR